MMRASRWRAGFVVLLCGVGNWAAEQAHRLNLTPLPLCLFAILAIWPDGTLEAGEALRRLTAARLAAVHAARKELSERRHDLQPQRSLCDFRANLHVHSLLSHDSRGTVEEIVAAAKVAGSQVILFTEHPADHYDFFQDGHQGMRDGVLLIPGAEMRGMLVYPRHSVRDVAAGTVQEFSNLVRGRQGLTFLSHLEERMDWEIAGITGVEIYNTHADFKDEKELLAALRNPLWLLTTATLVRKYPQEALSALQNYPKDYLRRWDQLNVKSPHTGVSANDAHQNVGLVVRLVDPKTVRVEDALGTKLLDLDATVLGALFTIPPDAKPGSTLLQLRLDPYECSLRHVGTHLLMPELSREAVWEALEKGRAFIAFDWIADSRGFDLYAELGGKRHEMGSRMTWQDGVQIRGEAPLAGTWKLLRGDQVVATQTGRSFSSRVTDAGVYRVELWVDLAGEPQIWILANPFYLTTP